MATLKVPYLKIRDGRPRWEPGPRLRAAGWKGADLKDEGGQWLGLEAAIAAATALNAEVEGWRRTGARRRRPPSVGKTARTVRHLYELWIQSPEFERKAGKTQRDYKNKARATLEAFGDEPVAAIEKHHLHTWWERMYASRGHAMANGVLAVTRILFSYAERKGWRKDNPARSLGLVTVAPRVVVWAPTEIVRLVQTADRMGLPSVGDAIVIALHTGQRQGDVLALAHAATANGWVHFRQGKRGARVSVPATPQLLERLAAIRARRANASVVELESAGAVVLDEAGRPYDEHRFRKTFRAVREEAARQFDDGAAREAFLAKQFLDLRDTAITRLALAGCTVVQIRSITGHKLQTIHQVLEHYVSLDDRMAMEAIERLRVWMEQEGIAL